MQQILSYQIMTNNVQVLNVICPPADNDYSHQFRKANLSYKVNDNGVLIFVSSKSLTILYHSFNI